MCCVCACVFVFVCVCIFVCVCVCDVYVLCVCCVCVLCVVRVLVFNIYNFCSETSFIYTHTHTHTHTHIRTHHTHLKCRAHCRLSHMPLSTLLHALHMVRFPKQLYPKRLFFFCISAPNTNIINTSHTHTNLFSALSVCVRILPFVCVRDLLSDNPTSLVCDTSHL